MPISLEVFLAELRRSMLLFRRYPVESIMGMLMTTILFIGMVYGARYIAGPAMQFGTRMEELIVSYVLWNILVFAMGEISIGLQSEAQVGTLEQLFLAGLPAAWVFLIRALANQVLIFGLNAGVLAIILVTTGNSLSFPPSLFLPIFAVLIGVYGLGFILGSLSLLYKRIGALMGLSQFGLMALIMIPFEQTPFSDAAQFLPLTPGAVILRDLMARGLALDPSLLLLATINSLAYFAVGFAIFTWVAGKTKERGLLGSY